MLDSRGDQEVLDDIRTHDRVASRQKCKGRLTVVEQVYFQRLNCRGNSEAVATQYAQEVHTDEQPYRRDMPVTTEWRQLDRGWIKGCSLFVLENPKDGPALVELAIIPSSEWVPEAELLKTLEPAFVLRPGRSMRGEPADLDRLFIRCPTCATKVALVLYPE